MMTPSERWMVGLDLTDMDLTLIKWVNSLSKLLKPKAIYFIHVEKHFDIPTYIPHELSATLQIADETQKLAVQKLLEEHFDNQEVEVNVEIIEGKPFNTILHWVEVKKIDFFIAGRKEKMQGNGVLPHKLSRKLSCSVLFIPEIEPQEIKKILVPVDFSDHSMLALKTALHIASHGDEVEIVCFHMYNVPLGYYKTGKSYDEFAELMQFNSIEHFQKFIRPLERHINFSSHLIDKAPTHELIVNEINEGGYDLVIVGSKGQSVGSFILLGSTTEKLIQVNNASLTWVVKKKDENISFFQAIKKI